MSSRGVCAAAALVLSGCGGEGAMQADAIERAKQATVEVLVDGQLKGSGVFVDARGLVVTGAHEFAHPGARVELLSASGSRRPATLRAVDKGHDLALLAVEVGAEPAAALPVAARIPPVGTQVALLSGALRNEPFALPGTVVEDEPVWNELAESNGYVESYYVAALTPSLTSGGPWIDAAGELVGIQLGRLNDGALPSGVAMIAPPRAIAELARRGADAATPGIGGFVWEVWTADAEFLKRIPAGTEGLVVTWLREGGPLARAGLERLDVITACDGFPLARRRDLLRRVWSRRPGERLRLGVLEPDVPGTREVEVELEGLEEFWRGSAGG